ncbi:hypothetical protein PAGU1579_12070 [Veillonella tobetsuensis]|uniref:Uncharacterized protein n=1 Tax=Veillonella tobetsuensis TaxID=1110546 RepID=A0A480BDY8_9FIRM|nr:hypothetical protein PAGU1579_12070 [Veillonella tobetsuensis]
MDYTYQETQGFTKGVIDASHKLSYDVSVPSYLPLGYTYYATRYYDNKVNPVRSFTPGIQQRN